MKKKKRDVIQQSLLPTGTLRGESFEISYQFSPYSEVGGDFADFFNLPDGRVGIYVGDVVGKGLSAAMYAALVMGMLRGIHKTGVAAASVLTLLNKRLLVRPVRPLLHDAVRHVRSENSPTRVLQCGHAAPAARVVGPLQTARRGGNAVRNVRRGRVRSVFDSIEPGDTVLFATDGLHELKNAQDKFVNAEELVELWRQCAKRSANESLDYLFRGVRAFANGARRNSMTTSPPSC